MFLGTPATIKWRVLFFDRVLVGRGSIGDSQLGNILFTNIHSDVVIVLLRGTADISAKTGHRVLIFSSWIQEVQMVYGVQRLRCPL